MMQENGPFWIPPGQDQAKLNPNAWNKRAGLLYLQAPAGVGYSESLSNDTITDETVAQELINSLSLFLDRHNTLKKNELYISGSGYGAVFATHLARNIIRRNKDQALIFWSKINLKGLLLGNPCVNPDECYASGSQRNSHYHYEFLYNRGFMTKKAYYQFLGACSMGSDSYQCYVARQKIDKDVNSTNTSAYNIYAKCNNRTKMSEQNSIDLGCEDWLGISTYLNDPHFRENWNIRDGATWKPCSLQIWNQYLTGNGSLHLIQGLVKDNMRLVIIALLSGCTRAIWTRRSQPSAQKPGLTITGQCIKFPSGRTGDNGGSPAGIRAKTKSPDLFGSWKASPWFWSRLLDSEPVSISQSKWRKY